VANAKSGYDLSFALSRLGEDRWPTYGLGRGQYSCAASRLGVGGFVFAAVRLDAGFVPERLVIVSPGCP
jgi:hypothetical protein